MCLTTKTFIPVPGMCTCVKWYVSPDGVAHILAGFEDGSVVLWDCRNNETELAALKLFAEPGNIDDNIMKYILP